MRAKSFILFILFLTVSVDVKASGERPTYFEPYAGMLGTLFHEGITNISGTVNGTTINDTSTSVNGDITGFAFGLKLYNKFFDQIILGGDLGFGVSSGELTMGYLTSMGKFTYVTTSPSLMIGWDMPTILFPRIYAAYSPIDSMSLTSAGTTGSDSYSGTSYKFGVSIDWWIQLGVEYGKHTFKTLNGNKLPYRSTTSSLTMTQEQVIIEDLILYISFPFTI